MGHQMGHHQIHSLATPIWGTKWGTITGHPQWGTTRPTNRIIKRNTLEPHVGQPSSVTRAHTTTCRDPLRDSAFTCAAAIHRQHGVHFPDVEPANPNNLELPEPPETPPKHPKAAARTFTPNLTQLDVHPGWPVEHPKNVSRLCPTQPSQEPRMTPWMTPSNLLDGPMWHSG